MSGSHGGLTVAVLGKDGRTDALLQGLALSPQVDTIVGASEHDSPGMLERCNRFLGGVALTDVSAITSFLKEAKPALVVIGPEEPLAAGLVDQIEGELHVPCFGPGKHLAQVEASKSWTRLLLDKYSIDANPDYEIVRSKASVPSVVRRLGDFVVKPDGLTGGKGVKVLGEHLASMDHALSYAQDLIAEHGLVLIEERLEGEEFSLQSVTDGKAVVHCPVVQDHKRAREGDIGPNTGGMGSYSCADFSLPFLSEDDVTAAKAINERVVQALGEEAGNRYHGVLYGGFIATRDGVKLIEYNARFGDPEAMNVLPLLSSDLFELCMMAATETLNPAAVKFRAKATVCKYVVPESYPDGKGAGDIIDVPSSAIPAADDPEARLYWAAVNKRGSKILLTGSRALAAVGIADTLDVASSRAQSLVDRITGPVRSRTDIGSKGLLDKKIAHMRQLRSLRGQA